MIYTCIFYVRKVHFNNIVGPFVVQSREGGWSIVFTVYGLWVSPIYPPV